MVEWHNAKIDLPKNAELVLAVKELKNGTRDICLARCFTDYEYYDPKTKLIMSMPKWVCGGNNNIIYWTPLPKIPEEEVKP